jgi:hypothetical protein
MDTLLFVLNPRPKSEWRTRDVTLDRAKKLALGWKVTEKGEPISEIEIFSLPEYSETEVYVPKETIEAALKMEPLAVVRPTYDCEKEEEPKQFGRREFSPGGFEQDMMR